MRPNIGVAVCVFALAATAARADLNNPDTDWMSARYGVGFHYLQNWLPETRNGGSAEWNATVNSFDVNRFASDIASTGAKWVLFTVGQNSGYYCAPCPVMNSYSGYAPGERCSFRDLPMDMANALSARGIRLVLYLPVNAPKNDARIANGFGLTTVDANGNWHLTTAFVQKWTQVVKEWSDRYGTRVSGWWFDGAYGANGWTSSWGPYYKNAAVSGNPDSIIALNGGAGSLSKRSDAQDYTAGEDGDLSTVCTSRWFSGLHCATFIPFGGWSGGTVKWTETQIINYTNGQRSVGATVTWNIGTSGAGIVDPNHVAVFSRIKGSIGGGTGPTPTPSPTPAPGGGLAGHYKLIARHSGKAVTVQSASTANGANVFQWTYGGTNTNDEWLFSSIGGGYYQILNRNSGKALAVQSASTANAANVFQWSYGGTATNDEWQPVDLGNGYFRIGNRNSGKVLNVGGASTSDGANIDQWSWANVSQQMFQVVSVP